MCLPAWFLPASLLICLCKETFVNKLVSQYEGTLKYLGESVTGMKTGLEMRQWKTELNRTFITNGYLAWTLAGVQMNHSSSSAHVQWFFCQNGGADDCDIIIQCHKDFSCIKGGNHKRGSATELEEFGCCYYCHLGVQAQVLGSLQSHRPSTSAVSVSLE